MICPDRDPRRRSRADAIALATTVGVVFFFAFLVVVLG